jgi:hypothetical protein
MICTPLLGGVVVRISLDCQVTSSEEGKGDVDKIYQPAYRLGFALRALCLCNITCYITQLVCFKSPPVLPCLQPEKTRNDFQPGELAFSRNTRTSSDAWSNVAEEVRGVRFGKDDEVSCRPSPYHLQNHRYCCRLRTTDCVRWSDEQSHSLVPCLDCGWTHSDFGLTPTTVAR